MPSIPHCSLMLPTTCIVRRTFRVHQTKHVCRGPVMMAATQLLFPRRIEQLSQAGIHMCFSCTDGTFLGHQIVLVNGKQSLERYSRKRDGNLAHSAGHTDLMRSLGDPTCTRQVRPHTSLVVWTVTLILPCLRAVSWHLLFVTKS